MESENDMCKTLHSILLLGGDMTPKEIEKNYEELTFNKCAYKKFGCRDISEFLNKFMKDKINCFNNGGCLSYRAIGSSKVEHVTDLIDRTKVNKSKRGKKKSFPNYNHNNTNTSYNAPTNYNYTRANNIHTIPNKTSLHNNTLAKYIPLSNKPLPAYTHKNLKYVPVTARTMPPSNKNINYTSISTTTTISSSTNIKCAPISTKTSIIPSSTTIKFAPLSTKTLAVLSSTTLNCTPISTKAPTVSSSTNNKFASISTEKSTVSSSTTINCASISTKASTVSSTMNRCALLSTNVSKISSGPFSSSYKYTGNSFDENLENNINHPFMKSDASKQKGLNRKVAFDEETSSIKITVACKPLTRTIYNDKPLAKVDKKLPATDENDSILLSIQQNLHNIRLGLENSKSKTHNSIFQYS